MTRSEWKARSGRRSRPERSGAPGLDRRRLVVGAVIVACLLFVAWRIIVGTNATTLARTDPETALEWQDDNAEALTTLAEHRLSGAEGSDDYAAAIELAERALVANPLDSRAIAVIALARNAGGETPSTAALMQRAAARSQRDAPIQGWLFNNALNNGDYAAALGYANAMLLTSKAMADSVLSSLQVFTIRPEARAALVARLALGPPWRADFFRRLSESNAPPEVMFSLLSDLALTERPPENKEIAPVLTQLIGTGQFDLAYLMWLRFLPKDQRGVVKYAFNGDFELPISGLPFEWTLPRSDGVTAAVVDTGEAGRGRALHLEFAGKRIGSLIARKILALPPGQYRLSGQVRALDLQTERGLVWTVACAGKDGAQLSATEPLAGTTPWRDFSVEFNVPEEGCRGQSLSLLLPARAELERQIGGEVWYDNIAIERLRAAGAG